MTSRYDLEVGRWSFRWSFRQGQHRTTELYQVDDTPDLTSQNDTYATA
jgi:hypothetical protein